MKGLGSVVSVVRLTLFLLPLSPRLLAVDLSTTNRNSLEQFFNVANQTARPVTVVSFGDSMANSYQSIAFVMMDQFVARLGLAGCSLDNWRNNLIRTVTNGAWFIGPSDLWFAESIHIPPGGGVWWWKETSPAGIISDSLGLFYVAQPNGGPFTVSVSTNNGPWGALMTLDGYADPPVGRFTNIMVDLDYHMLRVDGVSGTNVILGVRVMNSQSIGVNVSFLDYLGIGLDDVTNIPLSIRTPILQALAPDLLIWHMKEDGTEATRQRLIEGEQWWSNSAPNCSVLYIGTPYVSTDTNSTWTIDQNTVVRSIALSYHRAYVDCMTPAVSYPWMVSQGFMSDETHENLQGNTYLEGFAWNDVGFFALRTPRILAISPGQNQITLNFSTATNILYTLESTPDLLNWQPVLTNVGDGTTISTNFPTTAGSRLFRLSLRPAP